MLLHGLNTSADVKAGGGRPLAGGAKGREVETGAVARLKLLHQKTLLDCFEKREKRSKRGHLRSWELATA